MSKKLYEENDIQNIADAIREKNGSSDTYKVSDMATAVSEIPTGGGGEKMFTGHADVEGLKSIGWTDEDIAYFQEHGVCWDEEYDDCYKVTSVNSDPNDSYCKYLPKNHNLTYLYGKNALIGYADIKNNASVTYSACRSLRYIKDKTYDLVTGGANMFNGCFSLDEINDISLPNATNCSFMFSYCYSLRKVNNIYMPKNKNAQSMFNNCNSLIKITNIDIGPVTNATDMFRECNSLMNGPELDLSECTTSTYMFYDCYCLENVPDMNLKKSTNTQMMFGNCYNLAHIGNIDLDSVTNVNRMFYNCLSIETIGRLNNLGKAYSASVSENYANYTLALNDTGKLTHDSLMNVINGLYDIASLGVPTQKLQIGYNISKLTEEEIAIATAKGWTVS